MKKGSFLGHTTLLLLSAAIATPALAVASTSSSYGPVYIHAFNNDLSEGVFPTAAPTKGLDGNFYGATQKGGANGTGTIYQMLPAGSVTVLHSFGALNGNVENTDGSLVNGALTLDAQGNFWGTAYGGGPAGNGVVFSITPAGSFNVMHAFTALDGNQLNSDGSQPTGPLTLAPDGTLYGTTYWGGMYGDGVLFKVTTDGIFSVVHAFGGDTATEGYEPSGSVAIAADGSIYGADALGGPYGHGGVYKVSTDGSVSLLYSFEAPISAWQPPGAVILGADNNLYGYYWGDGATVYKLSLDGQFTALHSESYGFYEGNPDGNNYNSLAMGPDGNLYVSANGGGPYFLDYQDSGGALLRITPDGVTTVLNFFGPTMVQGFNPAPIQFSSDGTLWGATAFGGPDDSHNDGQIYTMPLPPPSDWDSVTPTVKVSASHKVYRTSVDKQLVLRWSATNASQCFLLSPQDGLAEPVANSGRMVRHPVWDPQVPDYYYQVSCVDGGEAVAGIVQVQIKE